MRRSPGAGRGVTDEGRGLTFENGWAFARTASGNAGAWLEGILLEKIDRDMKRFPELKANLLRQDVVLRRQFEEKAGRSWEDVTQRKPTVRLEETRRPRTTVARLSS